MPLRLPHSLPAIELLKEEGIVIPNSPSREVVNMRPLRIVLLNLMPFKITTETDFVRVLCNTPLQVELCLMRIKSHQSTHTPLSHINAFYKDIDALRNEHFDGMIITGAPVEHLAFEDVDYWEELTQIFDWANTNVNSTLYICWAAQAALYHRYGIQKHSLSRKMFGVFPQRLLHKDFPLFQGFDDEFFMPHSRHTEIRRDDILSCPRLTALAESPESGVSIITAQKGKELYLTGHLEYAPLTLDAEYKRDFGKRNDVDLPKHYYQDDDPTKPPLVRWRAHGNLLFGNWMQYFLCKKPDYDTPNTK